MSQISEKKLQGSAQIELLNSSQKVQFSNVDNEKSVGFNIDPYELGLLLAGFLSAMNSVSYGSLQSHHCYGYDCCDPACYFDYTADNCCMSYKMQDSLV